MNFLVHNIGTIKNPNYHTKEEVMNMTDTVTFDGVYRNIYENKDVIKHLLKTIRRVIIFPVGNFIGKDNSFDALMPLERFCDWNEIMELVNMGCCIGWHTWSHKNLTELSDEELKKEITPPFPMDFFAYPYGQFNDRVIEAVKNAGYKQAFSVDKGDYTNFQICRKSH